MSKQELSTSTEDDGAIAPVAIRPETDGDVQVTADLTPTPIRLFDGSSIVARYAPYGGAIVAGLLAATVLLTFVAAGLTPITPSPSLNLLMWALYIVTVPAAIALIVHRAVNAQPDDAPLNAPYNAKEERRRARKSRRLFRAGVVLVSISVVWGLFLTFFVLTNKEPIRYDIVVKIAVFSALLILTMTALVAWQIIGLWKARRSQQAGAGLHVRIVSLFGVVAIFPAILLAVFAAISIDRGIDQFSRRTRAIIEESVGVANAYLDEHGKIIRALGLGMIRELEGNAQLLRENPEGFQSFGAALALERRIPFAYLIDAEGKPVVKLTNAENIPFVEPTGEQFAVAKQGKFAGMLTFGNSGSSAEALKKLDNFDGLYLYIRLPVNPTVREHVLRTQANINEYKALEERRGGAQMVFAIMYVVIALTLLLGSVWVGLSFADRLVAPIRRLIGAAQDVSHGNLSVAVKVESPRSDMGLLSATFNRMTTELRNQRNALIGANTKLDERRRFMEAVLSGVTAGVIGVDANGVITLVNSSALQLIHREENELIGELIEDAIPEFAAIAAKAPKHSRAAAIQSQLTYRREGSDQTFSVRVTQEGAGRQNYGFVITFDDITALAVAQRTTAWADVARRIAHEIKNPLTPIQLSADRIRRKYGPLITHDREIFDRCTDTIIRHVGDIGRMVDEFSDFARMPKPVFEHHDAGNIVREAVILFQMSNSDIDYKIKLPELPFVIECDRGLLTQAVTNLVKNAGEAIASAKTSGNKAEDYRGAVTASVHADGKRCVIEVTDNGCGLPAENRARLTEPYVTTRQKGTGLGLAIVQRIAEQHDGTLELDDAVCEAGEVCGATIRLTLPINRISDVTASICVPAVAENTTIDEQAKHRLNGGKEGVTHGV